MHNHFLDTLSIEFLFFLTFLLMVLMLEVGSRFGQRKRAKVVKAQTAQVRALMGATLGLLAFMLAFTFSLALPFSAVMMLIMDLGRPLQNLFEEDVAVMRELAEFMRASL